VSWWSVPFRDHGRSAQSRNRPVSARGSPRQQIHRCPLHHPSGAFFWAALVGGLVLSLVINPALEQNTRALPQRDCGLRPSAPGRPIGRNGNLEVLSAGNVFDYGIGSIVPHVYPEDEVSPSIHPRAQPRPWRGRPCGQIATSGFGAWEQTRNALVAFLIGNNVMAITSRRAAISNPFHQGEPDGALSLSCRFGNRPERGNLAPLRRGSFCMPGRRLAMSSGQRYLKGAPAAVVGPATVPLPCTHRPI
jgi:hypothetical protein